MITAHLPGSGYKKRLQPDFPTRQFAFHLTDYQQLKFPMEQNRLSLFCILKTSRPKAANPPKRPVLIRHRKSQRFATYQLFHFSAHRNILNRPVGIFLPEPKIPFPLWSGEKSKPEAV